MHWSLYRRRFQFITYSETRPHQSGAAGVGRGIEEDMKFGV